MVAVSPVDDGLVEYHVAHVGERCLLVALKGREARVVAEHRPLGMFDSSRCMIGHVALDLELAILEEALRLELVEVTFGDGL